ncbi:hypothetical protein LYNGBM3L_28880 [Moorena producens 3L]|uniref:Uncharacterized protein n=1 Tax=Moorena producens 3L TaxID=489825 RepID=F4XP31_9CYAN|nr:hypothetical protein LYNGBM3L_28880 [Moorena producens 3L]OLT67288.1 hypothetical protein BI334_21685 [Moorena producens 3L]
MSLVKLRVGKRHIIIIEPNSDWIKNSIIKLLWQGLYYQRSHWNLNCSIVTIQLIRYRQAMITAFKRIASFKLTAEC